MQVRKVGVAEQTCPSHRYHEGHSKENIHRIKRDRSKGMRREGHQKILERTYCCFKKATKKKCNLFHTIEAEKQEIVCKEVEETKEEEKNIEETNVDQKKVRDEPKMDETVVKKNLEQGQPPLNQVVPKQVQHAAGLPPFPRTTSMENQMEPVCFEVDQPLLETDVRHKKISIKLKELDRSAQKQQQANSLQTKGNFFKMPSLSCEFQTVQSFGTCESYNETSAFLQTTESIPRRKKRPVIHRGGFNSKIYLNPTKPNAQTRSVTKEILQTKDTLELTRTLRSIMQSLEPHPNIVSMQSAETIFRKQSNDYYLQFSMQYYQKNIDYAISNAASLSPIFKKLICFQILKAVSYLHLNNIQHGYLDPTNILINKRLKVGLTDLKFARMGSMCRKSKSSWYYRAPEVVLGSQGSLASEMWSIGVIIAELHSSNKLFVESCDAEFLIEIMKLLGRPSEAEIEQMHPNYDKQVFYFPKVYRTSFSKISTDPVLIDLLKHLLRYTQRWSAIECLAHPYFAELKDNTTFTQLQQKYDVGTLFQFNEGYL